MPTLRFSICSAISAVVIALTIPLTLPAATVYTTVLSGANEVPPVVSTATGTSFVTLDGNLLTVNETFSGLIGGNAAAAHIHCCSAIGVNAAVAVPFVGFPTAASGTYMQTFDLTLLATYNGTFVTANGGTAASAQAALIAGLNAGMTYANIHDAVFPGGEIRGQLVATPEPATAGFILVGLGSMVVAVRRRRQLPA